MRKIVIFIVITIIIACGFVGIKLIHNFNDIEIIEKNDINWIDDGKKISLDVYKNNISVFQTNLDNYEKELLEKYPSNLYAQAISKILNELNWNSKTEFEKDFIECVINGSLKQVSDSVKMDDNDSCVSRYEKSELQRIKKAWKIGYNENDIHINGEDKLNKRQILLLIDGKDKEDYYIIMSSLQNMNGYFVKNNAVIDTSEKINKYIGLSDNNLWNPLVESKCSGNTYTEITDLNVLLNLLENSNDLLVSLDTYFENCYSVVDKQKANEYKYDPEIGMTKDEIEKSNWGKPENITTTQTGNGINETWFYKDFNYIHFVNGKVTKIYNNK